MSFLTAVPGPVKELDYENTSQERLKWRNCVQQKWQKHEVENSCSHDFSVKQKSFKKHEVAWEKIDEQNLQP